MEPTPFFNKKSVLPETVEDEEKLSCKSINIEEIFEFEAARQRALERQKKQDPVKPFPTFLPNRVFINHIDSFHGRHMAEFLARQVMGATLERDLGEGDEEENVEEQEVAGEDELEDDVQPKLDEVHDKEYFYEIIGTIDHVHYPEYKRTEEISDILDAEDKEGFLLKLQSCGFIIYDINTTLDCHPLQIDEATLVLESLTKQLGDMKRDFPKAFSKYPECRTFVLVSTLATWARTKPIDPEDAGAPFTERDYRKRKPHPNYKKHCAFEKKVIEIGKLYPKNLRTIVIGSGVSYGHEEDVLHFLFKMAWLNTPELPLFKPGNNLVPLIHIDSLASIVHLVLENFPKGYKYIIAVEQASTKLKQIVQMISKGLGTGKVIKVEKEEAYLYPDVKQRNYDMLTLNVNIEPGYIVEHMDVKWNSELPISENGNKIMQEFRAARNLMPIRMVIHGPPASGKSFIAKRLAAHYRLHYLQVQQVIELAIQKLRDKIQELKEKQAAGEEKENQEKVEIEGEEEEEQEEVEAEEGEDIEALTEELNTIEENIKKRMLSNPCQNQGFVVDGYPKTLEWTQALYQPDENEEEEGLEEEEESPQGGVKKLFNGKIMPQFVESLDASDEFLIRRVITLPESFVQNTHYVEEDMCRRLTEFRSVNTEDNTPLIFFDELEVHPLIYNVQLDPDPQMEATFQAILRHVGQPHNYGPDGEELEELLKREDELKKQKEEKNLAAKARESVLKAQERRAAIEQWMHLKDEEKEAEEKALTLLATPLRHYLMKYIFPVLTRGLVEVARIRPTDPVDFLAEFLFRENPEGKMFQPDQEEDELLRRAIEEFQGSIIDDQTPPKQAFTGDTSCVSGAVSGVSLIHKLCEQTSKTKDEEEEGNAETEVEEVEECDEVKTESSSESSCLVCTCDKAPPCEPCDKTPPCEPCESEDSSTEYPAPPGSTCTCPPTSTHCRCPL